MSFIFIFFVISLSTSYADNIPLNFNQSIENVAFYSGDIHSYVIDLKYGQGITVKINPKLNLGSLNLKIYSDQYHLLDGCSSVSNDETGYIEATVFKTGTYRIIVSGNDNARGIYTLTTYSAWFNVDNVNNNHTFFSKILNARYAQNGTYQAQYELTHQGNHFFRFTAKYKSDVSITVKSNLTEGYLNLYVYNSKSELLYHDEYISKSQTGSVRFTVQDYSNLFYIKVSTGDNPGSFDLYTSGTDFDIDTDDDGLNDSIEFYHESNPFKPDSDNNGISDYNELLQGFVPGIKHEFSLEKVQQADNLEAPIHLSDLNTPFHAIFNKPTVYAINMYSGQIITMTVDTFLNQGSIDVAICNNIGECKSEDYIENRGIIAFEAKNDGEHYILVSSDDSTEGHYNFILYDSWINTGADDCNRRNFYSTYQTARCAVSGNYIISKDHTECYRFDIVEDSSDISFSLIPHLYQGSIDFYIYENDGAKYFEKKYISSETTLNKTITFYHSGSFLIIIDSDDDEYGNYDFSIKGSGIGSCVYPESCENSIAIKGKIVVSVAGYENLNVKNAIIRLYGTNLKANSDDNGLFTLNIPDSYGKSYQLIVDSQGFASSSQQVMIADQDIQLETIHLALSNGSCSENELIDAAYQERKKWDIKMDNKKGLAEAIDALRVISDISK